MTFEELEQKLRSSCLFYREDGKLQDVREFKTLTLWRSSKGYKIAVRYAGEFYGKDFSSAYKSSLREAFDNLLETVDLCWEIVFQ